MPILQGEGEADTPFCLEKNRKKISHAFFYYPTMCKKMPIPILNHCSLLEKQGSWTSHTSVLP